MVDGGDLLWSSIRLPEPKVEEAKVKAELIAESLALAGIDAMVPGKNDFALGMERLKDYQQRLKLPYVAANLVCDGKAPFEATRVVERDGWRVTFVGVVPEGDEIEGCVASEPFAALKALSSELGPADILIALGPFSNQNADAVVEALPNVDFIVAQNESTMVSPKEIGTGHFLLGSGGRGKKVGVLKATRIPDGKGWRNMNPGDEIEGRIESSQRRLDAAKRRIEKAKDEEARQKAQEQADKLEQELSTQRKLLEEAGKAPDSFRNTFTNLLVDLGTDVADHAPTLALVTQAEVKLETVGVNTEPGKHLLEAPPTLAGEEGSPFAGSAMCRSCHEAEYRSWRQTDHSRAFATLVKQQKQRDPACVSCHITGAFHAQGPKEAKSVGSLANVGCESCHGPSRAHAENPQSQRPSALVDPNVCLDCHTKPGDPGKYDPVTYMERIKHKGVIQGRK